MCSSQWNLQPPFSSSALVGMGELRGFRGSMGQGDFEHSASLKPSPVSRESQRVCEARTRWFSPHTNKEYEDSLDIFLSNKMFCGVGMHQAASNELLQAHYTQQELRARRWWNQTGPKTLILNYVGYSCPAPNGAPSSHPSGDSTVELCHIFTKGVDKKKSLLFPSEPMKPSWDTASPGLTLLLLTAQDQQHSVSWIHQETGFCLEFHG